MVRIIWDIAAELRILPSVDQFITEVRERLQKFLAIRDAIWRKRRPDIMQRIGRLGGYCSNRSNE